MKKVIIVSLNAIVLLAFISIAFSQEGKPVRLPTPDTTGGKPLMQALKDRKTSREYSNKPLSLQMLSDLLWAAFGVNRPDSGGRTAPSAMNCQEIEIYVAMDSGLYLYDSAKNTLEQISAEDIRSVTGKQPFVKDAAINLIFVADLSRAGRFGKKTEFYTACDAGYVSQNVYLYCASAGLATVARGMFDEKELSAAMKLTANKKIILTQTVGHPK
ncbi:MAG: SagB/ThcOx family dehydrogenase [Candidatus Omnitrophota bacterium]